MLEGTDIGQLLKNIRLLSAADIFVTAMSRPEAQREAVRLNTTQLKDKFINSEGVKLSDIGGEYSPSTMAKGKKKSPSSVDLYDTGDYHKSFRVENVSKTGFDIVSDSVMDDGTDLKVEWGEEIEGLTTESQEQLAAFLWDIFGEEILNTLAA